MNKQDRQNKNDFKKGERETLVCLPAPCSPLANVTIGERSTLSRKQGLESRQAPHKLGRERGHAPARGKHTSEPAPSLS